MDRCKLCKNEEPEVLTESHKATDKHRFNYLLFEWTNYRKKLAKNRHGMVVTQNIKSSGLESINAVLDEKKGRYTITVTSRELSLVNNEISFKITVLNDRKEDVMYIMNATVLNPYKAFEISDVSHTCSEGNVMPLKPKNKYEYEVHFKLPNTLISEYKIPLAFTFQQENNETVNFSISREIVITVSDYKAEPEDKSKNPFKFDVWRDVLLYIPPCASPRYKDCYKIPEQYHRIFMTGLADNCRDPNEAYLLNFVKNCLCPDFQHTKEFTGQYPTESNYQNFFHFLLWIDEVMQKLLLQGYNMSNVYMNVTSNDMLELEVPGLAEKRPSLITGDIVNIRYHEQSTVYKAIVCKINDKTIWINKMHPDLLETIKKNNKVELDVSFELSRLSFERMHHAIDVCIKKNLLKILFPSEELAKTSIITKIIPDKNFFNKSILNNKEQKKAVVNILSCTSRHAPYIVYGPPGTGKTLTIVEAILQIKQHIPSCKILICAPANAACDMLAEKLIQFVQKKDELIRIHTESRYWGDVPDKIKPYSNHDGKNFYRITFEQLSQYKIVITTLVLIGKYSGHYNPDYVFIDEAAQAFEPEADIAVSMLSEGKQLILAGDPKQLGPQCASKLAAKHKLENSLLERLMDTNSLYKNGDDRFITMLKLNYRAHPQVLHIPNKLFYEGQLTAVSREPMLDPLSQIFIHPLTLPKSIHRKQMTGAPIEFCSVVAKEQREGKSPSYFNEPEIQMVVKYIKAMLSLIDIKVEEHEIGVISPYIRQVHRIKNRLQANGYKNIEVGTTEAFQGREKRVIIISTVRGQSDLLLFDQKYNLGFVKHEKRMNVALTRAKTKLIVIGNPQVLGTDKNWEEYIKYCEENNAFFGAQYLRRTGDVMDNIINRFSGIKFGDVSAPAAQDSQNKNQGRHRRGRRAI